MSATKPTETILVPTVEEVPRISDAERAELLASLEESRAEYAAGNSHVLKPGMLRKELPKLLAKLTPVLQQDLRAAGVGLERDASAWLSVLACYTLHPDDDELRALSSAWMQGCQLDSGEAEKLGLSRHQAMQAWLRMQ